MALEIAGSNPVVHPKGPAGLSGRPYFVKGFRRGNSSPRWCGWLEVTHKLIQRIATVAVYVEDQDRALEFWRDQLGFEVRERKSMGNAGAWLEVAPEGAGTRVVIFPKSLMPDWNERKPSIVFECDDIHATYESLKDKGVEFEEEPKTMSWGAYATFRDTDGNEYLLKG